MIRLDFAQGSAAWFTARLGIPTASQFHRLITPRKAEPAAAALLYRHELVGEYLSGQPADTGEFDFTARGSAYEERARAWYELHIDDDVDQVGFLLRDDRRTGGSPDGFVGTDGIVEFKVPSLTHHVGHLCDGFDVFAHRCQQQGNLWIAERAWCDLVSWHPWLPPVVVRYQRDDVFIKTMATIVESFCDQLAVTKELLKARGIVPRTRAEAPGVFVGVG